MELRQLGEVRDGDIVLRLHEGEVPQIVVHPESVRPDILEVIPSWGRPDREGWAWMFTFVGETALETILPQLRAAKTREEFEEVFDRFYGDGSEKEGQVWPQTILNRFGPVRVLGHSTRAEACIRGEVKRGRRRGRPHRMRMPSPSLYLTTESERA